MKKILFILILLVAAFFANAATDYYCTPTGNDTTGNGSIGTSWRMPSKATAMVTTPGDIIHVAAGTYQDNNYCNLSPGVSIEGAGKATTTIKTSYVYASSPTTVSFAYIKAYSSTVNTNGNQHISGISFDGLSTSYRAITVYRRGNVAIYDCGFTSFRASAAIFYNAAYTNITEPSTYVSGNSFYNNTVTNCASYGMTDTGGLVLFAQEDMSVYNNVMTDVRRSDVGYTLISGLSNRKLKIYGNTFKKGALYSDFWTFALEIRFNHGEIEIYNNTCEGILDVTYNLKRSTAYGLWIHDNTFGSDDGITHQYGITLEADNIGVRVERNLFKNLEYGFSITTSVVTASQVDSVAIIQNVFRNIGYPLTRGRGGAIRMSGSSRYPAVPQYRKIMIYNNTIVGNGYAVAGFWLMNKGYYDNIKLINNIIYNFDQNAPYGPVYVDKDAAQTMAVDSLTMDHNLTFATGNSNNPVYLRITPTNTSFTGPVKANPLLISATDLHLQSLSPAINAGIDIGLPYLSTAPDIGYSEYVFENPAVLSTVLLDSPYNITSHTLAISANVVLDGGGTVAERGIVWNTSSNPTTANNKQSNGIGIGDFLNTIQNLVPNTTYYIRAYSINEAGTAYSSQQTITTPIHSYLTVGGVPLKYGTKTLKY